MKEKIEQVEDFLNKKVAIRYIDDFTIYGILKSVDRNGIVLETSQETSFISFNKIQTIRIDKRGE